MGCPSTGKGLTVDEIRVIELRIAKALGFKTVKATLYSPAGTLMGGNYKIHAGIEPETPESIVETWESYTPRFARSMDDASWLLDELDRQYGIEYNLFRDGDGWHTCEVGHWSDEAGGKDQLWQATEHTMALAVAKAVERCDIVMEALRVALGEQG